MKIHEFGSWDLRSMLPKPYIFRVVGVGYIYIYGCCQNYGPFLDPYYNTAPSTEGTQKGP